MNLDFLGRTHPNLSLKLPMLPKNNEHKPLFRGLCEGVNWAMNLLKLDDGGS